jgi:hypothetical protein
MKSWNKGGPDQPEIPQNASIKTSINLTVEQLPVFTKVPRNLHQSISIQGPKKLQQNSRCSRINFKKTSRQDNKLPSIPFMSLDGAVIINIWQNIWVNLGDSKKDEMEIDKVIVGGLWTVLNKGCCEWIIPDSVQGWIRVLEDHNNNAFSERVLCKLHSQKTR